MAKKERIEKKEASKSEKELKLKAEKESQEAKDWSSGAKNSTKKLEEERKRLEMFAKKAEREAILAQEEKELSAKKPLAKIEKLTKVSHISSTTAALSNFDAKPAPSFTASNIDDAISLLDLAATDSVSQSDKLDRHPERRVKSAFAIFEERELPKLKEENKGLRLTQLKQMLAKKWKKSPENPMNQESIAYNATREEEREVMQEKRAAELDRMRSN